jgi:hypothetical protein
MFAVLFVSLRLGGDPPRRFSYNVVDPPLEDKEFKIKTLNIGKPKFQPKRSLMKMRGLKGGANVSFKE